MTGQPVRGFESLTLRQKPASVLINVNTDAGFLDFKVSALKRLPVRYSPMESDEIRTVVHNGTHNGTLLETGVSMPD